MAGEVNIASVVKGGETCIQALLSRRSRKHGDPADWKGGLSITVKAVARVEEFMANLCAGETADVSTIGRYWLPLNGNALRVYAIQNFIQNHQSDDGSFISLDRVGHPLILQADGDRYSTVNLSFLRLRGISEGEGVTFGVKGVYSLDEMRKMEHKLGAALRRFYIDYLRPVDLFVTVSTQETQL